MAVAFDAATASTVQLAASSVTFSHTVSGADRVLIVGVAIQEDAAAPRTVSSVTYAGTNLTSIRSDVVDQGTSGGVRSELWRLIAPATGANSVVVTLSGVATAFDACAVSVTGAHQTTPETAVAGGTDVGVLGSLTVTVTSTANDLVVDTASVWCGDTATLGAGQTSRMSETSGCKWFSASTKAGAATSQTMSRNGYGAGNWCTLSVVSIAQAAAAATFVPNTSMTLLGIGH